MAFYVTAIIFAPLTDITINDTFGENPAFVTINWGKKINPNRKAQWMINELKPLNTEPPAVRSALSC